ncbi:autotransporter outer membrane beta-barrel domain-containing protein [Erwinia sp. BNK-24-b]|uniref:autotransporter outer membrane beta-barrel domain-containing protein n=1 Tax=unclassified Erwinia TaxID=2622719 RepID=UPI0039BF2573
MKTAGSILTSIAASLIPFMLPDVALAFTEEVAAGRSVAGETLDDSGSSNTQQVYGTATGTTINSGGVQILNPGGITESSVINSGGTLLNQGGRDSNTTVNSGGIFTVGGQAGAIAVSDNAFIATGATATVNDYAQTNNWTIEIEPRNYVFLEGSSAVMNNTRINSGYVWLKTGTMVGTTLNSGNFVNIAGTDIDTVINKDLYILGGKTQAWSQNLTINKNGYGNLNSGTITDATINGSLNVAPNYFDWSILSSLRGNIAINDGGRLCINVGSDTGNAVYTVSGSGYIWLATNESQSGSYHFSLGDVTLAGGTINYDKVGYSTLTMKSLAGSGSFYMNTMLNQLKGDFLSVTGSATGNFAVYVEDKGTSPEREESLQIIQIGKGDASFTLANSGNVVDLGTYQYYLIADGQGGWSLTPQRVEPAPLPDDNSESDEPQPEPDEPGTEPEQPAIEPDNPQPKPDEPQTNPDEPQDNPQADAEETDGPTDTDTDADIDTDNGTDTPTDVTPVPAPATDYSITPATAAVLSVATADPLIFRQELEILSERLAGMAFRNHERNVWGTFRDSRLNVSNEAGASYRMKVNALTIGADRAQRNEESLAVQGVFFSYSHSDMGFRGKGLGKANIESWSGGGYGLWQHDSGYWLDGTLKLNRFVHDVHGRMTGGGAANGRFNTLGVGSNVNAGKAFRLGAVAVTPFVSLTGFTGKSSHLTLNNGMKAHIGPQRSLLTAAGIRAEYAVKVSQAELRPWASISLEQENIRKNRVKVNHDWFKNDLSGRRGHYQAGIRAQLSPTFSTHVGAGYMKGKHVESPWNVTAGASWRF